MLKLILYFIWGFSATVVESARILTVVPSAYISHQVVFRPLVQELAKRGHEVTLITTDPAFPKGHAPKYLREVDLHDLSYGSWKDKILTSGTVNGSPQDSVAMMKTTIPLISQVFETQVLSEEVQNVLKKDFDLLILEAWFRPALGFSHIFKNASVIQVSSFSGMTYIHFNAMGAPTNPPLLYPTIFQQKLNDLSIYDKLNELFTYVSFERLWLEIKEQDDEMMKRLFGKDVPSINELEGNVDMLFLNVHPIWDLNRPIPSSVQYIGGIHQKEFQPLPEELQSYLDSSKNGVIYISYGSNIKPASLPAEKIQMMVNVFSKLPYDVLWKWDSDELPGQSKNIRISKWLPQADLLTKMHPKLKLFITQGGLHSTDEAIDAGVPLIGMPMMGDQWYNVEQYVRLEIGLRLDLGTITETSFLVAVNTVLNDDRYRKNIVKLRSLMRDQPQSGLERAVWWTEHVLRHGGARHLRAPAANITWMEYLDAELLAATTIACLAIVGAISVTLFYTLSFVVGLLDREKIKKN